MYICICIYVYIYIICTLQGAVLLSNRRILCVCMTYRSEVAASSHILCSHILYSHILPGVYTHTHIHTLESSLYLSRTHAHSLCTRSLFLSLTHAPFFSPMRTDCGIQCGGLGVCVCVCIEGCEGVQIAAYDVVDPYVDDTWAKMEEGIGVHWPAPAGTRHLQPAIGLVCLACE